MKSLPWPWVALAFIATAGFTGIYYISDPDGRSVLLPVVVSIGSTFTTVMLARRLSDVKSEQIATRQELEKVKQHVNGNTMKLLDKIPDADRPNSADVPQLDIQQP